MVEAGCDIWSSVVAVQIGGTESFASWLAFPILHKQAVNRYKYLSAGEHLAQGDLAPRLSLSISSYAPVYQHDGFTSYATGTIFSSLHANSSRIIGICEGIKIV